MGPENEKTPRGCERSARGSETRCPLPRGFCRDSVVTADRRAAAHNHGGSKHGRSLPQMGPPLDPSLTMRSPPGRAVRRDSGCAPTAGTPQPRVRPDRG
ncbi:hypothetical protein BKD26_32665 [Streptomyces sp. CB03238]|nr:hypothetical protein BKD26_32665 [Streptomyces sp. CB03238]